MANFFSRYIDRYIPLFFFRKDEKRLLLKKMRIDLSGQNNTFYNPISDKVLPEFARYIKDLSVSIQYLNECFRHIEMKHKKNEESEFQDIYIESFFSEQVIDLDDIKYESIAETLEASNVVHRVDSILSENLKKISKKEVTLWDQNYEIVEKLRALSDYSIESISIHWDIFSNKPKKLPASILLQPLLDLYYLMGNLNISPSSRRIVQKLFTDSYEERKFTMLNNSLALMNNGDYLKTLLRIISLDPFLELSIIDTDEQPVGILLKKVIQENKIFRQKQILVEEEVLLTRLVEKLFDKKPLTRVEYYNRHMNEQIMSRELPALKYVSCLELVANIDERFCKQMINNFLQELQLNVDFSNEDSKKRFQSCHDKMERVSSDLNTFNKNMSSSGYSTLIPVQKVLNIPIIPGEIKKDVVRKIDETNEWVDQICQNAFSAYMFVNQFMTELAASLENNQSEMILNGHILKNSKSELYEKIQRTKNLLNQIVKLLNRFIVKQD